MNNQPLRTVWGLAAAGATFAVGYSTRDAGLTAVTLLGGLVLPRLLGFGGFRRHGFGPGRGHDHGPRGWSGGHPGRGGRANLEERLAAWHRQAHGEQGPEAQPTATTPSGSPA